MKSALQPKTSRLLQPEIYFFWKNDATIELPLALALAFSAILAAGDLTSADFFALLTVAASVNQARRQSRKAR